MGVCVCVCVCVCACVYVCAYAYAHAPGPARPAPHTYTNPHTRTHVHIQLAVGSSTFVGVHVYMVLVSQYSAVTVIFVSTVRKVVTVLSRNHGQRPIYKFHTRIIRGDGGVSGWNRFVDIQVDSSPGLI